MSEVRLSGISKCYSPGERPAVERLDLTLPSGELAVLVGPSGCGKSTLLRLCNGNERPSEGWAYVGGRRLIDLSRGELKQMRSRIGFVHQGLDLVPNLRVSQNVLVGRLGQVGFARSLSMLLFPSRN